jgi:hypothetical protein
MAPGPERPSFALYRGIRQLIVCDSGDVVSGIVDFVVSQNRVLRLLERAMQPGTPLAVAVILLNALRCFVGVECSGHGAAVIAARRPNERREIARLKRMIPNRDWTDLVFRWRPRPMGSAVRALLRTMPSDYWRAARLARLLSRRYGVFRALRVLELIAYYRRYVDLFSARSFQLAVMSSHSNPHGIALNLAATQCGVPVVLITHGMPVRPIARLDYGLAIMECEASRQVYEEAGCRMNYVVIKSRQRDFRPMRESIRSDALTVGLFLSKDPVEGQVVHCLRALLSDPRVARIIIRPHPVNLWSGLTATVTSLDDPRLAVRSSGFLEEDLRHCDLVLGGNSTVLLDAVISGRPACYVRGFDHGPYDVQEFVRDTLIYEWTVGCPIDAAIERFYRRPAWSAVLRRYADIDHSDEEVTAAVIAAVNRLSPPGMVNRHEDNWNHPGPDGIVAIPRQATGAAPRNTDARPRVLQVPPESPDVGHLHRDVR